MNKWMISGYKVRFKGHEGDVYGRLYDILTWLVQVHLDALCLFGSILLTLQVTWKKLFCTTQQEVTNRDEFLPPPDFENRSFTVSELQQYDGIKNQRIYFAVNGRVFDATHTQDIQYFMDGPFNHLAGRDASRALATFSLDENLTNKSEMDDLSDLNPLQMDSLFHWEMQCVERYPCVGRLVRSHQPRALQNVCIRTICGCMGEMKGIARRKAVDELPLPRLIKNQIIPMR
ncbi:membrane-associated progesterone receptor component 1-like [Stylophora pistillata]|uniref:membrane-associated progesterone receptor component 1-like n=1 Tax=Stylophora pistillata TaxID=50429 RepID=UPI000C04CFF9|nr:membrane-associated progesterone receptor component 1-like [Stylophora pistillata]